ncbi:MAG: co-chaperone GroES [Elusimicrobiota bacterium]
MKIRPLGDRILVKPLEKEDEKIGSIIVPETAKEKPQEGKVEAVGPGKLNDTGQNIPMNLKAGDTVLYGKYSGTEVKIDGVEYLIMHEDDVFGVVG